MAEREYTVSIKADASSFQAAFKAASGVVSEFTAGLKDGFHQGLAEVEKSTEGVKRFGDEAEKAGGKSLSSFESIALKITGVVGALDLAGKAMSAIGGTIEGVFAGIERGGALNDLSQRLGVAVETLSSLELGASTAGVSMDQLGIGIQVLSRNMAEAAGGGKDAQAAFAALGVSVTDAGGQLKSTDEVLAQIAQKFSDAQDGAGKTAAAMDLMGRSGASLIPWLNEGAAGLQKWSDLSSQLGLTMTRELAGAMDTIGDSVTVFGAALTSAQNQLAIGMAPALEQASLELVKLVSSLGIADGGLRGFGQAIGEWIRDALGEASGVVKNFQSEVENIGVGPALVNALNSALDVALAKGTELGVKIGGSIVDGIASEVGATFTTKLFAIVEEGAKAAKDWGKGWLNSLTDSNPNDLLTADARQRVDQLGLSASQGISAFDKSVEKAKASAQPFLKLTDDLGSAFQTLGTQVPPVTSAVDKSGEAHKKSAIAVQQHGEASNKAADAAEKLRERFEEQIRTQTEAVEKMEGQNAALEKIIEGNLSAAEAQKILNDETGKAAERAAVSAGATAEEAAQLRIKATALAEVTARNRELDAIRNAQVQNNALELEIALTEKVNQGLITQLDKEIEIARARANGNVQLADQYEHGVKLKAQLEDQKVGYVHLGDTIKSSFEGVFDALIAGTLDFGDSLKSLGLGIGKDFFSGMLDSKFKDFDPTVKANFLDLGEFGSSIFGRVFSGLGDLISGDFAGAGNSILSIFSGGGSGAGSLLGGSGGALGAILPLLLGAGPGAALGLNSPGLSIAISTLSLLDSGLALGTGAGLIGTLFGSETATTIGSLLGPEIGGHIANGIDAVFGPGVGASALIGDIGPVLSGAGAVLGGAGGAFATWNLVQGGQSALEIAASLVAIVAGGAAILNAFGPIGTVIYGIVLALTAIASALTDITPTAGTLRRRLAESTIDSIKTFEDLQKSFGDISRASYNVHSNPELPAQREQLGDQALTDITAFSTLFSQATFGSSYATGKDHVASIAQEWTNILTEFFSRMEGSSEEVAAEIRTNMLSAFRELGINDATKAFEVLNGAAANFKLNTDFNYFQEPIDQTAMLGTALRGIGAIFETELPPGVHVAALAMETLSRDGQKAFADLDNTGRETLLNLADDAENFDKVAGKLLADGFQIDTEEFDRRLKDIVASAEFVGENISTIFEFNDVGVGIDAMMSKLGASVLETVQKASIDKLFDTTNIAAAFEPVYAVLDRIDEFDLTTATGANDFMSLLGPALAEGKANLQEYIPILQVMIDNWKEIQGIIDEAMKPDVFEQAAQVAEEAFGNLGGALNDAITAGMAVLEGGGTWDEAVRVFENAFGSGVERSFKDAIFNAIVQANIIQPLIASYQPAFAYVIAAGLELGFKDPRVIGAIDILMNDVTNKAKDLGLIVFQAKVDSDGITSDIEKAFNDAAEYTLDWAGDVRSTLGSALDAAFDVIANGGSAQEAIDAWNDALGDGTERSVTDGIVRALINAAIIEPFIKEWAPIIQYWTAAALANGPDDPRVKEAYEQLFGPNSDFQQGLNNIPAIAIDWYWNYAGGDAPPGAETPGLDLDGSQSGSGGRRGRTFPGAAVGGSFPIGQTLIVGENGPELLTSGPDGITVTPLSPAQASAMLDPASTQGRTFPDGGRTFPTNPPGGGRTDPHNPVNLNPHSRDDDFRNPTTHPRVPPPPGQHPGGGDGGSDSDYELKVSLSIDSAIEDFLRGGDFADFTDAFNQGVNDSVAQGLLDAIMNTGPLKAAMDKFNEEMSSTISDAWADGSLSDEEIAKIKAKMEELGGPIKDIIETLGPEAEKLFSDLGIDTGGVSSSLRSALESAFTDFASGGSTADMELAIKNAFKQATLDGIIEALLTEGPIRDAIDKASGDFKDAFSEAMKDGIITEEEAQHLRDLGEQLGSDLSDTFTGIGEGIGGVFEGLADSPYAEEFAAKYGDEFRAIAEKFGLDIGSNVGNALAKAGKTGADLIGGALKGLLNDPSKLNIENFSSALKQSIYQNVAQGLIDAFIQTAVIQGALAVPLGIIQAAFAAVAAGQISAAQANVAIAEQIAAILGIINSGAFQSLIQTMLDAIGDIGAGLGIATGELGGAAAGVSGAAAGFNDAADAAADACAGTCDLEHKLQKTKDKIETLDGSGRQGTVHDEYYGPDASGGYGSGSTLTPLEDFEKRQQWGYAVARLIQEFDRGAKDVHVFFDELQGLFDEFSNTFGGDTNPFFGQDNLWIPTQGGNYWPVEMGKGVLNDLLMPWLNSLGIWWQDWTPTPDDIPPWAGPHPPAGGGSFTPPPAGSEVPDFIWQFLKEHPDFLMEFLTMPGLPHLAAGGVVTRPTMALFGEAGPEAVIPLNRLFAPSRDNAREESAESMREELRESARVNRDMLEELKSLRRDAQRNDNVPLKAEIKINDEVLIDAWTTAKRTADRAGIPL